MRVLVSHTRRPKTEQTADVELQRARFAKALDRIEKLAKKCQALPHEDPRREIGDRLLAIV